MSAKRGAVYQVVPVEGRWIVRAAGRPGESYDRLEDALVAAEALVGSFSARNSAVEMSASSSPKALRAHFRVSS